MWTPVSVLCNPLSTCDNFTALSVTYSSVDYSKGWTRITVPIPSTVSLSQSIRYRWMASSALASREWAITNVYIGNECPGACNGRHCYRMCVYVWVFIFTIFIRSTSYLSWDSNWLVVWLLNHSVSFLFLSCVHLKDVDFVMEHVFVVSLFLDSHFDGSSRSPSLNLISLFLIFLSPSISIHLFKTDALMYIHVWSLYIHPFTLP